MLIRIICIAICYLEEVHKSVLSLLLFSVDLIPHVETSRSKVTRQEIAPSRITKQITVTIAKMFYVTILLIKKNCNLFIELNSDYPL